MVGGRDFEKSNFNRATQAKRQPGSAFKPFVYAAALEQGYSPATIITNLDDPIMTLQGAWVPEDEHSEESSMTMRAALRTSSNRAAVRMLRGRRHPGHGAVREAARRRLGSERAVARARIRRGHAVVDDGGLRGVCQRRHGADADARAPCRDDGRRGAVQGGTGPAAGGQRGNRVPHVEHDGGRHQCGHGSGRAQRRVPLPAAGKTGTTNDYHDAWFVGFTPQLATGVWVGYDQPRTIIGGGYASVLAVPVWGRFMAAATSKDQPEWFSAPSTITSATICRLSGKLATDSCHENVVHEGGATTSESTVYTEYFVRGHGTH